MYLKIHIHSVVHFSNIFHRVCMDFKSSNSLDESGHIPHDIPAQ